MEDQDEILEQSIVLRNSAISGDIELQEFNLIVLSTEGGAVQGGGVFEYGTNAPLSASPDDNYTFDGWSGDGVLEPNTLSTSVYITQDQTITGIFESQSIRFDNPCRNWRNGQRSRTVMEVWPVWWRLPM